MKHLRLNTLFHWLYCILMLAPFIIFIGTIVIYFSTGAPLLTEDNFSVYNLWINLWTLVFGFDYSSPVLAVFEYLADDLFHIIGSAREMIIYPLAYWVYVSFFYLVFDVLMIPVNLFHRWIDEGSF